MLRFSLYPLSFFLYSPFKLKVKKTKIERLGIYFEMIFVFYKNKYFESSDIYQEPKTNREAQKKIIKFGKSFIKTMTRLDPGR